MTPFRDEQIDELRLVGVEDGSFEAFPRMAGSYTILCCVEMSLGRIENIGLAPIKVDGLDATEKLLLLLDGAEVEAVILGGITFAGFNIIDPFTVFCETGFPIIVYSGVKPDSNAMRDALMKHFEDWRARWSVIERLEIHKTVLRPEEPPVFFEVVGMSEKFAEGVLRSSAVVCRIPEPVRVAGIIARGISRRFY